VRINTVNQSEVNFGLTNNFRLKWKDPKEHSHHVPDVNHCLPSLFLPAIVTRTRRKKLTTIACNFNKDVGGRYRYELSAFSRGHFGVRGRVTRHESRTDQMSITVEWERRRIKQADVTSSAAKNIYSANLSLCALRAVNASNRDLLDKNTQWLWTIWIPNTDAAVLVPTMALSYLEFFLSQSIWSF